jgi:branched-chain amino acid transport system ATP-binding protein
MPGCARSIWGKKPIREKPVAELLHLEGVRAGYGDAVVLEDIDFSMTEGASLALLGRNGVGKSTLLMTLMGLTHLHAGRIQWKGASLAPLPPYRRAQAGLGWVPQERLMFPSLTVEEHLTAVARPGHWNVARVYEIFPSLGDRCSNMGNQLSGGEQQMLAIGRILRTGATLLLLDEPTEGLAPVIVQQIGRTIRKLKEEGLTILLVEQNFRFAQTVADRHYVMESGRVIDTIPNAELEANMDKIHEYLGV